MSEGEKHALLFISLHHLLGGAERDAEMRQGGGREGGREGKQGS